MTLKNYGIRCFHIDLGSAHNTTSIFMTKTLILLVFLLIIGCMRKSRDHHITDDITLSYYMQEGQVV